MQLILDQLLENVETVEIEAEDEVETAEIEAEDGVDEVSFLYYGEHCNCSKQSKCRSKKCLCFLRGDKCSSDCHDLKTKCANN